MVCRQRFFLAIIMIMIGGCADMHIKTDFDPSVNFNRLKTFRWIPGPQKFTGDPRIDDPLLDSQIRTAVEERLSALRYTKSLTNQADFFIGYHAGLRNKRNSPVVEHYATSLSVESPSQWNFGSIHIGHYAEGALLLTIYDGQTQKPMWRGSAQTEVDLSTDPRDTKTIKKAVRLILERFPPKEVRAE